MNLSTNTAGMGLWGLLMFVALGFEVVFAALAFVYTRRLLRLRTLPLGDDLNGYQKALRKLRKDEPMSRDEWNLAERIIDIRRAPIAYAVPAAFMTLGIFYILGSLEYLHGHTPSERTFLGGVIPMFTSTNLIIQMRKKSARLKKKLGKVAVVEPDEPSPAALTPFG